MVRPLPVECKDSKQEWVEEMKQEEEQEVVIILAIPIVRPLPAERKNSKQWEEEEQQQEMDIITMIPLLLLKAKIRFDHDPSDLDGVSSSS